MAKPVMLKILYTEPGFSIPAKYDISSASPDFFNYLKDIKVAFKKQYGKSKRPLSLFLQMLEAHIFIERIYTKMSTTGVPSFTKHDSLLVKSEFTDLEIARKVIISEFELMNFKGNIVEETYRSIDAGDIQYNHPYYNMIIMDTDSYFPDESSFYDLI
jgi:hypothetical protein